MEIDGRRIRSAWQQLLWAAMGGVDDALRRARRVSPVALFVAVLVGTASGTASIISPLRADEVLRVAALVDRHIAQRWSAERVTPSSLADDAEYFRRIHLDIGGVIPQAADVRQFLADTSPDKRRRAVNDVLGGPRYVVHFDNVLSSLFLPVPDNQPDLTASGFGAWVRRKLIDEASYAEIVREVVTASLDVSPALVGRGSPFVSPAQFFQSRGNDPAAIAGAVARSILGLRIECAQCHDHPFDQWDRQQFWSFAAFFGDISPRTALVNGRRVVQPLDLNRRILTIPDSDTVVTAWHLDGAAPAWQHNVSSRITLADWITRPDNPYFARATVNRLWSHFFGAGLVEPVDDFSSANPASHGELLDELAAEFVTHDFDLKFLIRALTASGTYQRSSQQTQVGEPEARVFATMSVKGLTQHQFYDSLVRAAGAFEPTMERFAVAPRGVDVGSRSEIMRLFADAGQSPREKSTTILQALAMMNGRLIQQATDVDEGATLSAVSDFPLASDEERIEALFLATLGRYPCADELERLVRRLHEAPDRPRAEILADIHWALLNSAEFKVNH
jgi:hypothetical protein